MFFKIQPDLVAVFIKKMKMSQFNLKNSREHQFKATSLLRPLKFWPKQKLMQSFCLAENPLISLHVNIQG